MAVFYSKSLLDFDLSISYYECTEKNYSRGAGTGICGGAGYARTPTYTGPLLAGDLFTVEPYLLIIQLMIPLRLK